MSLISPSQIRYVWVTFDNTGSITGHINGSSVVKNDTGDFTVNFHGVMPSQYYGAFITPVDTTAGSISIKITSQTPKSIRFVSNGGAVNILGINVSPITAVDANVGYTFLACS